MCSCVLPCVVSLLSLLSSFLTLSLALSPSPSLASSDFWSFTIWQVKGRLTVYGDGYCWSSIIHGYCEEYCQELYKAEWLERPPWKWADKTGLTWGKTALVVGRNALSDSCLCFLDNQPLVMTYFEKNAFACCPKSPENSVGTNQCGSAAPWMAA